jgi:ketosteroid isomerase-like protein
MRTLSYLAATAMVAVLAGCSQAPAGAQFTKDDVATITKNIEELRTAFNAKDADKTAALFSANAVVMPPNQSTSRSKESVKQYYVGRFQEGASDLELEPKDISGNGTLAYASGDYRLNLSQGEAEPHRDRGKFVWILRKTNGSWLIDYVIFSSDFAPRAAAQAAE